MNKLMDLQNKKDTKKYMHKKSMLSFQIYLYMY